MALITTTRGDMEDHLLRKTAGGVDNDTETTTWVEYCLRDCDGSAHRTGTPDAPHLFCRQHVHRSVDMTLKKGFDALGGVADLG